MRTLKLTSKAKPAPKFSASSRSTASASKPSTPGHKASSLSAAWSGAGTLKDPYISSSEHTSSWVRQNWDGVFKLWRGSDRKWTPWEPDSDPPIPNDLPASGDRDGSDYFKWQ